MSGEDDENVHQEMNKSSSVKSDDSTLSFQSDDLTDDKIYEVAPWDIFGDAEGVGRVKVAKVGDNLPLTTGYKVKKDGSAQVGVKFRISEYLGVEVVKVKNLSASERDKINGSIACSSSSEGKKATPVNDEPRNNPFEEQTSKEPKEKTAATKEPPVGAAIVPDGPRTKSKQEWLHDFSSKFLEIVVGGMEASIRKSVANSIHEKKALKGKANQAVINSVNHAIFEFIGNQRPTKEFCRDVAEIIKKHIPDTYAVVETMESVEFGSLPVKKAKGEGGQSDLATRIGNNYYNDYLRAGIKRPELASQSPVLELSNKKLRKFYAVSSEKWYIGSKISQEEYDAGERDFSVIVDAGDDIEKVLACVDAARVFIQIQFRSEDPSTHITKYRIFWKMPYGPKLLSNHFEWLVDGSRDGDLAFSIEDHIDMVLKMTAQILGEKKGDVWIRQLEEVENKSRAKNGNEIMSRVFIIRELAKSWKNNPAKLIFVEGEDSMSDVSSQPYVNILKVDQPGEGDYDERIIVSVRVGTTTIFDGVSLT